MDAFLALAEPTRRNIMEILVKSGNLSASDIYRKFKSTPPAISQHLKVLREAGLVSEHQEGTRHICRLNPIALAALRDQLDTYWRQSLTNYTQILADDTAERSDPTKQRKEKS